MDRCLDSAEKTESGEVIITPAQVTQLASSDFSVCEMKHVQNFS